MALAALGKAILSLLLPLGNLLEWYATVCKSAFQRASQIYTVLGFRDNPVSLGSQWFWYREDWA